MYNIGDFVQEVLNVATTYTFVGPTKGIRPPLPYVSIVPIVSNQGDIHQHTVHKNSVNLGTKEIEEFIETFRKSQFSITAIGIFDSDDALDIAQELHSLFHTQGTTDWFQARAEAVQIISPVTPRFVIEDSFDEARFGFDIQVNDRVTILQQKEYIDQLTITDTDDKITELVL